MRGFIIAVVLGLATAITIDAYWFKGKHSAAIKKELGFARHAR
jgi:hypothetical protein